MVKALSTDHNTSNAQERERVYSVGGTIKDNRYVTTGSIVASVFLFVIDVVLYLLSGLESSVLK